MKQKLKPAVRRNPYACDPIMRKGGAHRISRKAERVKLKRQLRREYPALNVQVVLLRKGICETKNNPIAA